MTILFPRARGFDLLCAGLLLACLGQLTMADESDTTDQPIVGVPVQGFIAPAAGEHPRLYMRRSDIPALRATASTERGKEVIKALLEFVNGGTQVGPPPMGKGNEDGQFLSRSYYDASAYGALYQITGDTHYADLARQSIERFYTPEALPILQKHLLQADAWPYSIQLDVWVGEIMAYDLCYDAWDPAFRKQVAERLARVAEFLAVRPGSKDPFDVVASLADPAWTAGETLDGKPSDFFPGMGYPRRVTVSNLLLLGLKGDPEASKLPTETLLPKVRSRLESLVPETFGEHGRHRKFKLWGWMIPGDFQLDEDLLAWRNAGGINYTTDERVRWIHLQWIAELLERPNGGYWVRRHEGGSLNQAYGELPHTSRWSTFPDSFALLNAQDQGALLWSWNHTILPSIVKDPAKVDVDRKWDLRAYPYRAISVLQHWPEDSTEVNPATMMLRPYVDHDTGSVVFRNRWKDGDDVVIDCWPGGSDDFRNPVVLWARGKRTTLGFLGISKPEQGVLAYETDPNAPRDKKEYYAKAQAAEKDGKSMLVDAPASSPDGSGSATYAFGNAIAVDFSMGGNTDVLIAMTGPGVDGLPGSGGHPGTVPYNKQWNEDFGSLSADTILTVGDRRIRITTVGSDPQPKPEVVGDTVQVGSRIVRFDGAGLKIVPKP